MNREHTYQEWKDALAAFVRYRMKAMGLSAEDLAGEVEMPLEWVRGILQARGTYPSHKLRERMAKPLGCSLEFVKPKGGAV